MPKAGDFVARGLGNGVRPVVDRWLSHGLARMREQEHRWPQGGFRAVLKQPNRAILMVVLPSRDLSGRRFPLAACTIGAADVSAVDRWADAALPFLEHAVAGQSDPDMLAQALQPLEILPSECPLTDSVIWSMEHPRQSQCAFFARLAAG